MRELLEDGLIALPDDDMLMGDLVTPKWKESSSGKIQVEGKEDIRKRIARSTDHADAVMQVMWRDVAKGSWENLDELIGDDMSDQEYAWRE